jgi:hypothetical protein
LVTRPRRSTTDPPVPQKVMNVSAPGASIPTLCGHATPSRPWRESIATVTAAASRSFIVCRKAAMCRPRLSAATRSWRRSAAL